MVVECFDLPDAIRQVFSGRSHEKKWRTRNCSHDLIIVAKRCSLQPILRVPPPKASAVVPGADNQPALEPAETLESLEEDQSQAGRQVKG